MTRKSGKNIPKIQAKRLTLKAFVHYNRQQRRRRVTSDIDTIIRHYIIIILLHFFTAEQAATGCLLLNIYLPH